MRKNNTVESSLARAFTALAALPKTEVERLSIRDCAIILAALPDTRSLQGVRQDLAIRLLAALRLPWIKEGSMTDVFLALGALSKHNSASVSGQYLALAVQRLVASEVKTGGPYRDSNGEVTIEANAAIAFFLRTAAKPLPNIESFLRNRILRETEAVPLDMQLFLALVPVCDTEDFVSCIVERCEKEHAGVTLRAALGHIVVKTKTAQQRLDARQALTAIRRAQLPTGLWTRQSFFLTDAVVGSAAVTTALLAATMMKHANPIIIEDAQQQNHDAVVRAVHTLFNGCTEPLRSIGIELLYRICQADMVHEITLLPHLSAQAMEAPVRLSAKQYRFFGAANLCTWIAYMVYDDFLDGGGAPEQLPAANLAMRAAEQYFQQALPQQKLFHQYVGDIFKAMDEANAWEVNNCRFAVHQGKITITELPAYGDCSILASRSFAHALPSMGVFLQQPEIQKTRDIERAFRHYLIARQLNDDLHDWREDLQTGQVSYVVAALLQQLSLKADVYDLDRLLPVMMRCFRQTVMPRICEYIMHHIHTAKRSFIDTRLLRSSNDLYDLLEQIELSAQQSLDLAAKGKTFFDTMRDNKARNT